MRYPKMQWAVRWCVVWIMTLLAPVLSAVWIRHPSVFFDPALNGGGACDQWGYVRYSMACAEEILVGTEFTIPIRFEFTSNPSYTDPSCMGAFCRFPLLESSVVLKGDEMIANLPGGLPLPLHRDPANAKRFVSDNKATVGELKDGDVIELHESKGWTLRYRASKIAELISPKGAVVRWVTEKGRVKSLVGPAGVLMELSYRPDGLLEEFHYVPLRGQNFFTRLTYDTTPKIVQENDQPKQDGVVPTLASIFDSWGNRAETAFKASDDFKTLEGSYDTMKLNGKPNHEFFRWSTATRFIIADDVFTYEVIPASAAPGAQARITRRYPDGRNMISSWDSKSGEFKVMFSDGATKIERRSIKKDASYGRVLERREIRPAGTDRIDYRADYDDQGRIIHESDPKLVKDYKYLPASTELEQHDVAGNFLAKQILNTDGRILRFQTSEFTAVHEYLADGKMRAVHTAKNGDVTTSIFNVFDDLLERTFPDGSRESHTYSAPGNRSSSVDRKGSRWFYESRNDHLTTVWKDGVLNYAVVYDSDQRRWMGVQVGDDGKVSRIRSMQTGKDLAGKELEDNKAKAAELFEAARQRLKPPPEVPESDGATKPAPKAP